MAARYLILFLIFLASQVAKAKTDTIYLNIDKKIRLPPKRFLAAEIENKNIMQVEVNLLTESRYLVAKQAGTTRITLLMHSGRELHIKAVILPQKKKPNKRTTLAQKKLPGLILPGWD